MLIKIYKKYQYFFNLLMVLFVLTIIRTFDWILWSSYTNEDKNIIITTHVFEFFSAIPIILLLIYSYTKALKHKSKILIIIFILLFMLLGMVLIKYVSYGLKLIFWKERAIALTKDVFVLYLPNGIVYFIILSASYFLTYFWQQYIKQKEAFHKTAILAKDAQLKMLRYQINPHFLFNSLNSLHALIDENKNKGKELIISMSEYYRYTLNNQQQTTSIEMEVEAIRKYLEVQKIRFEEKFIYEIVIDEDLNSFQIPSFIILLLIENAIKYGVKSNVAKLEIRFIARKVNNTVVISVQNTGKLINQNLGRETNVYGTGTGIENIKNRLSLFYNDNYTFSLNEFSGYVEATIVIFNNKI